MHGFAVVSAPEILIPASDGSRARKAPRVERFTFPCGLQRKPAQTGVERARMVEMPAQAARLRSGAARSEGFKPWSRRTERTMRPSRRKVITAFNGAPRFR